MIRVQRAAIEFRVSVQVGWKANIWVVLMHSYAILAYCMTQCKIFRSTIFFHLNGNVDFQTVNCSNNMEVFDVLELSVQDFEKNMHVNLGMYCDLL